MEGFDDPGIYYSDNLGSEDQVNETQVNNQAIKKKFKDFIRQFHEGNFNYKYRYVLIHNIFYILINGLYLQRCPQAAVQPWSVFPGSVD